MAPSALGFNVAPKSDCTVVSGQRSMGPQERNQKSQVGEPPHLTERLLGKLPGVHNPNSAHKQS